MPYKIDDEEILILDMMIEQVQGDINATLTSIRDAVSYLPKRVSVDGLKYSGEIPDPFGMGSGYELSHYQIDHMEHDIRRLRSLADQERYLTQTKYTLLGDVDFDGVEQIQEHLSTIRSRLKHNQELRQEEYDRRKKRDEILREYRKNGQ